MTLPMILRFTAAACFSAPGPTRFGLVALLIAAFLPSTASASNDEGLLLASAHAERILLPPGSPPTLELEPLSSLIVLRTTGSRDRLAAALSSSGICPVIEIKEKRVILRCRTRQLDARLAQTRTGWALDLRELRGLPWKDGSSGPPLVAAAPDSLGLGGPCPGTTPAGRGECALAAGRLREAETHFLQEEDAAAFASLRLGDLALALDRPAAAAHHYQKSRGEGPWGRLAEARICELLGHCLGTEEASSLFRSDGLPQALRVELDLRAARYEAFAGDPAEAARFLLLKMSGVDPISVCPEGQHICSAIALAALRQPGFHAKEDALALFFALPDRRLGPRAAELASAAADVSAGLGAPVFGANLLAATTGSVRQEDLEDHLHQAAGLYLLGGDRIRAAVILDYARFRFGEALLASSKWNRLVREGREEETSLATGTSSIHALTTEAAKDSELLKDLAQAVIAAARARTSGLPTP